MKPTKHNRSGTAVVAVLFTLVLASCTTAPAGSGHSTVLASEGVKKLMDETEGDALVASGERVRCERQRRVGSHRHTKICMTVAEWAALRERTKDEQRKFMPGVCSAPAATGSFGADGSRTGALLATNCGDSINRGQ